MVARKTELASESLAVGRNRETRRDRYDRGTKSASMAIVAVMADRHGPGSDGDGRNEEAEDGHYVGDIPT